LKLPNAIFSESGLLNNDIGAAKKAVRDWTMRNHKNLGNPLLDSNRQMGCRGMWVLVIAA
jgi:hypothetical protein